MNMIYEIKVKIIIILNKLKIDTIYGKICTFFCEFLYSEKNDTFVLFSGQR